MKKIRLDIDSLAVESFDTHGGVHAANALAAVTQGSGCVCSAGGCYPSFYCSIDGPYQLTCQPGCMTNANGLC